MTIEENQKYIDDTCEYLNHAALHISQLQPVTHLSQSKIQFSGGVLGAIQEYREDKRLVKLMNTVIYKDVSFYQFGLGLFSYTEMLVAAQIEIQKNVPKDDEKYYGNITLIIKSIDNAFQAWYNYSPDMAVAGIKVGDTDDVNMALSIDSYTKEEYRKLDLPEGVVIKNNDSSSNSGCFGILVALIAIPSLLLYLLV